MNTAIVTPLEEDECVCESAVAVCAVDCSSRRDNRLTGINFNRINARIERRRETKDEIVKKVMRQAVRASVPPYVALRALDACDQRATVAHS